MILQIKFIFKMYFSNVFSFFKYVFLLQNQTNKTFTKEDSLRRLLGKLHWISSVVASGSFWESDMTL